MVASHALLRQMMLRALIALLLTLDESQKMNNNNCLMRAKNPI